MSAIGRRIKDARLKAKLTEKQLAKKCGVAESFIIQVEEGRKVVNEKTAENILKKLGAKLDSMLQEDLKDNDTDKKIKPVKEISKPKDEFKPVEPTGQWADALANIIKKYPVYEIGSSKIVAHKNLPILEKKVEGCRWDKIMFVRYNDTDLRGLRIHRNDTIMVYLTNDIQNNCIYLFEMDNKRMIRQLRKESNKIYMGKGNEEEKTIDSSKIKLIGKCVKVEHHL